MCCQPKAPPKPSTSTMRNTSSWHPHINSAIPLLLLGQERLARLASSLRWIKLEPHRPSCHWWMRSGWLRAAKEHWQRWRGASLHRICLARLQAPTSKESWSIVAHGSCCRGLTSPGQIVLVGDFSVGACCIPQVLLRGCRCTCFAESSWALSSRAPSGLLP